MSKINQLQTINLTWDRNKRPFIPNQSNEPVNMKPLQLDGFDLLKGQPHKLITAPMGSGKTLLMCFLSAFEMRANPKLKVIISVPQLTIAGGFVKIKGTGLNMQTDPTGKPVDLETWAPEDLCATGANKMARLKKFVASKKPGVIVCTHATLVKTFKAYPKAFSKDLALWIDEAHHLRNADIENREHLSVLDPDRYDANEVGKVLQHFLKKEMQTGLATATPFRGDETNIFGAFRDKYTEYAIPFDVYFNSLDHLEEVGFSYAISENFGRDVAKLIKHRNKAKSGYVTSKDIVFLPHIQSNVREAMFPLGKERAVKDIIAAYRAANGGKIKVKAKPDGVIVLDGGSKANFTIVDLVTPATQKSAKAHIESVRQMGDAKQQRDAIDVVIALGMFKEGADWIHAERNIIMGNRNSLTELVQISGRVLRDVPGKKYAETILMYPNIDVPQETIKDKINNVNTAIHMALLLEIVLDPPKKAKLPGPSIGPRPRSFNPYSQNAPDLIKDIMLNLLTRPRDPDTDLPLEPITKEVVLEVTTASIARKQLNDDPEEVTNLIWNKMCERLYTIKQYETEEVSWDHVTDISPVFNLYLPFFQSVCGINSFHELRQRIGIARTTQWATLEECQQWAKDNKIDRVGKWKDAARPLNMPGNVPCVYNTNWTEFFNRNPTTFITLEECKQYAKDNNITTSQEWMDNRLPNMPSQAATYYKTSWQAFFDKKPYASRKSRASLEECRKYVMDNNLTTWKEFIVASATRPDSIPSNPPQAYGMTWNAFVGKPKRGDFKSLEECRKFAHDNGVTSASEWMKICPLGMPVQGAAYFKLSWPDFLQQASRRGKRKEKA